MYAYRSLVLEAEQFTCAKPGVGEKNNPSVSLSVVARTPGIAEADAWLFGK